MTCKKSVYLVPQGLTICQKKPDYTFDIFAWHSLWPLADNFVTATTTEATTKTDLQNYLQRIICIFNIILYLETPHVFFFVKGHQEESKVMTNYMFDELNLFVYTLYIVYYTMLWHLIIEGNLFLHKFCVFYDPEIIKKGHMNGLIWQFIYLPQEYEENIARIANAVHVTLYSRATMNVEIAVLNFRKCNQCLKVHKCLDCSLKMFSSCHCHCHCLFWSCLVSSVWSNVSKITSL